MLRQIVLVSLAMAACTALVPAKANAATLTFPALSITKIKEAEISQVITVEEPNPNPVPNPSPNPSPNPAPTPSPAPNPSPTPNPNPDPNPPPAPNPPGNYPPGDYPSRDPKPGEAVPVPEPLTIFGTATALGGGVLLKQKSSKKKKS